MIHFQRLDFLPLVRLSIDMPEVLYSRELADDLARILREIEDDRAHARRVVSIIDLTGAPVLDAKQRAIDPSAKLAALRAFEPARRTG